MKREVKRLVVAAGIALCCAVGFGNAHAANLLATENVDTAVLTPDANWDRTPFTSIGSGESVDGSGAFLRTPPAPDQPSSC
jgi:hypothetical protein